MLQQRFVAHHNEAASENQSNNHHTEKPNKVNIFRKPSISSHFESADTVINLKNRTINSDIRPNWDQQNHHYHQQDQHRHRQYREPGAVIVSCTRSVAVKTVSSAVRNDPPSLSQRASCTITSSSSSTVLAGTSACCPK